MGFCENQRVVKSENLRVVFGLSMNNICRIFMNHPKKVHHPSLTNMPVLGVRVLLVGDGRFVADTGMCLWAHCSAFVRTGSTYASVGEKGGHAENNVTR